MAIAVNEPVTLGPLERLEALCDPGSLHVFRSEVSSRRMGDRARAIQPDFELRLWDVYAANPKARYLVGPDAKKRAWVQRLPVRWRDRVLVRFLFGS